MREREERERESERERERARERERERGERERHSNITHNVHRHADLYISILLFTKKSADMDCGGRLTVKHKHSHVIGAEQHVRWIINIPEALSSLCIVKPSIRLMYKRLPGS